MGVWNGHDAGCTARSMEQLYVGGSAGAGQSDENPGLSDRGSAGRTTKSLCDYYKTRCTVENSTFLPRIEVNKSDEDRTKKRRPFVFLRNSI